MSIIEKAAKRLEIKRKFEEHALGEIEERPSKAIAEDQESGLAETLAVPVEKELLSEADKILGRPVKEDSYHEERSDLEENWVLGDVDPNDEDIIRIGEIGGGVLLSPEAGKTRTAEEFRIIKRPLLIHAFGKDSDKEQHPNLIGVSSAVQGEGKTFISLNLAISIAMEMDSTVLLIDADVAKPGLSKVLGVPDRPGLIDKLTNQHESLSGLLLRTDIPKLTVLPAGSRHKRSTELLASQKMRELVDEMASRYPDRIVLFDSPPLLLSTEASVLTSSMGQVVLVVESQSTSQMLVKEAIALIGNQDRVSMILNKCKENVFASVLAGKYTGYGYGYGYGTYGNEDGKN